MKTIQRNNAKGPLAVKAGLAAFFLAGILALVDVRLALVLLAAFLVVCLAAPFFPRFGFYAPVIYKGRSGRRAVALTFDDGPDPMTTPRLLDLLEKNQVTATFFVVGKNARAHPELIDRIVSRGHLVGNHSFSHSTFLFFKNVCAVIQDIEATQTVLSARGVQPLVYRPPVGIISPRLWPALVKTGMVLVNFSCRPLDGGNRRLRHLARRVLRAVKPDDIVVLHDKRPPNDSRIPAWLQEVEAIVAGIQTRGLAIVPLSDLITRPVMKRL